MASKKGPPIAFVSAADSYIGQAIVRRLAGLGGEEGEDKPPQPRIAGSTASGEPVEGLTDAVKVGSAEALRLAQQTRVVVLSIKDAHDETASMVELFRNPLPPPSRVAASAGEEADEAEDDGGRTIVAVSTVHTWARSRRPKDGSDISEERYKRRRAAPEHENLKLLEAHVMALAREGLRAHVVAAGIPYGAGEGPLHKYFKAAWEAEGEQLLVPALAQPEGRNFVPMVHVDDCASVVAAVAEGGTEQEYVLALDGAQSSLRQVFAAISRAQGTRGIRVMDPAEVEAALLNSEAAGVPEEDSGAVGQLQLDLKLDASDGAAQSLGIEWKCYEGIAERAADVAAEYRKARGIRPVKVVVGGAPGAGKSVLAEALASHYYVERVDVPSALAELKAYKQRAEAAAAAAAKGAAAGGAAGGGGAAGEDGEGVDEGADVAPSSGGGDEEDGGAAEEEEEEKPGMEPEDEDGAAAHEYALQLAARVEAVLASKGRLGNKLLARVMRWRLRRPRCRNRGYILDGYPRTFAEAESYLREGVEEDDLAGEEEEEEEGAEGGGEEEEEAEEEEPEPTPVEADLVPTGVIVLDAPDSALERLVAGSSADGEAQQEEESKEEGGESAGDRLKRRLALWRKRNPEEGAKTVAGFFETSAGIEVIERSPVPAGSAAAAPASGAGGPPDGTEGEGAEMEGGLSVVDVSEHLQALCPYIERGGKPFNYHPTLEEIETEGAAKRAVEEAREREEQEAGAKEAAEEEAKRASNEAEAKRRLALVAEHERELLLARTAPLRDFLAENVLPTLSKGLLEVCAAQPADPVDYLAEYLLRAALEEGETEGAL